MRHHQVAEIEEVAHRPGVAGRFGRAGQRRAGRRRFASLLADKAYSSEAFRQLRYVLEQTFALLHQFRRLAVRGERRLDIHDRHASLAGVLICWRRFIDWTQRRSC